MGRNGKRKLDVMEKDKSGEREENKKDRHPESPSTSYRIMNQIKYEWMSGWRMNESRQLLSKNWNEQLYSLLLSFYHEHQQEDHDEYLLDLMMKTPTHFTFPSRNSYYFFMTIILSLIFCWYLSLIEYTAASCQDR